jgi:N6-adenosine-specific RNA methylase IME4
LLLVGTRDNIPAPLPGEQPPQIIAAPRGRHSEKPEASTATIEQLYPTLPRVELFARTARRGWDCWGNEVQPMLC